jgi:hypothetical protein
MTHKGEIEMRVNSLRLVTVGVALAAGALLSACSGQNAGAPVSGGQVRLAR